MSPYVRARAQKGRRGLCDRDGAFRGIEGVSEAIPGGVALDGHEGEACFASPKASARVGGATLAVPDHQGIYYPRISSPQSSCYRIYFTQCLCIDQPDILGRPPESGRNLRKRITALHLP